jgi:hypothetical protein
LPLSSAVETPNPMVPPSADNRRRGWVKEQFMNPGTAGSALTAATSDILSTGEFQQIADGEGSTVIDGSFLDARPVGADRG